MTADNITQLSYAGASSNTAVQHFKKKLTKKLKLTYLYTSKNRILSRALHSFMLRRCDVMANSVFSHKFSAVPTVYDKFAAFVAGFN